MLEAIIEQYGVPAFGVSLVLTLVWLAGGRRNLRLDAARLQEILHIEGMDETARTVISADQLSALALADDNHPGLLIRSQGDYWTATALTPGDTRLAIDPANDRQLLIRFSSPGQTGTRVTLSDAATVETWLNDLTHTGRSTK